LDENFNVVDSKTEVGGEANDHNDSDDGETGDD
jgi:hypothetical protein